jgi:hypothetical protein
MRTISINKVNLDMLLTPGRRRYCHPTCVAVEKENSPKGVRCC